MPGIFDDERRGSGPMAPDPGGTGRFFARAASRAARGDQLLALGDVASARLFYRLAATKGSARGATAMGST